MYDRKKSDEYIDILRKIFGEIWRNSEILESLPTFANKIESIFKLDIKQYGKVIDCLYLLEDTQLAKDDYNLYKLEGPTKKTSFGEKYLRLYGVLNACFLQKEALKVCLEILELPSIQNEAEIFEYRNIFAAHTPNKNVQKESRSFILCRFSLNQDRLKGYSYLGSDDDTIHKDEYLPKLIEDWDSILVNNLELITEDLFKRAGSPKILNQLEEFRERFVAVKQNKLYIKLPKGIIVYD